MRTTNDIIEQIGITRSHEQAHKADIILLVFDNSQPLTSAEITAYNDILTAYNHKIIVEENPVKKALLIVTADITRRSLTASLQTLGIEVPERM